MRFVALKTPEEREWLEQRVGLLVEPYWGIVAYDNNGKICSGFVSYEYGNDSCRVHLAIDNPAVIRRGFLTECLEYVFLTRGVKRIFGMVESSNHKALKFNHHIGFRAVSVIPEWDKDGTSHVIMRMDNPWVKEVLKAA